MLFAAVIFFGSFIGIVMLFSIKYWEMRTKRVIAPAVRTKADVHALQFKELLAKSRIEFEKLPPEIVHLTRVAIHESALGVAAFARALERGAHKLADMASHKHRFERRESTNDYLKQVIEHKNGNGLDSHESA